MADLLQTGLEWLAARMKGSASRTVTYIRGTRTVAIKATFGKSSFTADEADGARRTFTSTDFVVQAADLILNSAKVLPERRDQIIDGDFTYEVHSPAGERHWRWLDGLVGHRLRIHTKLIETA